jgi:hypothetical protein
LLNVGTLSPNLIPEIFLNESSKNTKNKVFNENQSIMWLLGKILMTIFEFIEQILFQNDVFKLQEDRAWD